MRTSTVHGCSLELISKLELARGSIKVSCAMMISWAAHTAQEIFSDLGRQRRAEGALEDGFLHVGVAQGVLREGIHSGVRLFAGLGSKAEVGPMVVSPLKDFRLFPLSGSSGFLWMHQDPIPVLFLLPRIP